MLIFETTHCNKTSFQVRFHEWSHECTQKKALFLRKVVESDSLVTNHHHHCIPFWVDI